MTNDIDLDDDNDGCADTREVGPNSATGGGRNPHNFWDLFDTPDGANVRDRAVVASDIQRLVRRFGAVGDKALSPLSAPPATGYHPAFDRTRFGQVPNGQRQGPNGSISAEDLTQMVLQFANTCA